MNEDDIKNTAKNEVNSLLASLPIEIRGLIGILLVYFLFIGGFQFIGNKDNFSSKECWKLEYHNDRIFKFNSCSGELVELDPKTLKKISYK